jgi:membrane protein YdbS with pleckstrin-like domain
MQIINMASDELVRYVEESLAKGHARASIVSHLERTGWPRHEIDAAFGLVRTSDTPVPGYAGGAGTGHHAKFFNLQEGESILFETKPLKGLMWYMAILGFFPTFIIMWIFGQFFVVGGTILSTVFFVMGNGTTPQLSSIFSSLFIAIIIFFMLAIVVDLLVARRRYNMRYYWLTDKRIIVKKGFIGYSINSIPLERISDVMISRSLVERIFGFGSLHIQSLAGQYSIGGRLGAEGNLEAIPDPEKNQELIFRLVKEKRKTEHLTM